jgi:hypothetical protein
MDYYYVNDRPQDNGDHEVHTEQCQFVPVNKTYLGFFSTCKEAIAEATKKYPQSNGCKFCSPSCHTS